MTATATPFGLRPIFHPSGQARPSAYAGGIVTGYASAIGFQSPVKMATTGVLQIASTAEDWLGSFAGVEWTDSTGMPRLAQDWAASTAGTNIIAYVNDDPKTRFAIQSDGSLALTSRGDQADFVNPGTVNALGFSSAAINSTLGGAGVQKQLRILDLYLDPANDWGDAFTIVVVENARHQYVANKVAI